MMIMLDAQQTESAIQEASARMVRQEVIYCVSSLVYGMTRHVHELSREAQNDIGFTEDDSIDLWTRAATLDDYRDQSPESLEVVDDAGDWKWRDGDSMWSEPFDSEIEAYRAAHADLGLDVEGSEIYEHWIVSDWLAGKLEARGETVARDVLGGLTIWGRPTTGQAISMDEVIRTIAAQYFIGRPE